MRWTVLVLTIFIACVQPYGEGTDPAADYREAVGGRLPNLSPTVSPTPVAAPIDPALAQRYRDAGERLDRERKPHWVWADGSNWHDGRSHEPPSLPIPLGANLYDQMTCMQNEVLLMAVFPEGRGYDQYNWHLQRDADEISAQWEQAMAEAVWGSDPGAAEARKRADQEWPEVCGHAMTERGR